MKKVEREMGKLGFKEEIVGRRGNDVVIVTSLWTLWSRSLSPFFFFSMFFYDGQSGREGEKETQGKEKGMCYGLGNEGHDMN